MSTDANQLPFEIDCQGVKALQEAGESFQMLDVRTPEEHQVASLPETTLLPIQEIADRVGELDPHRNNRIVVFCHHGGRSERVAAWLREQGVEGAQNMTGGIDAWAVQIDPPLPRY